MQFHLEVISHIAISQQENPLSSFQGVHWLSLIGPFFKAWEIRECLCVCLCKKKLDAS